MISGESPFEPACVLSLARFLLLGDPILLGEWVVEHVGPDPETWQWFALTLAGLSSESLDFEARVSLHGYSGELVYSPSLEGVTGDVERLSAQFTTMAMNRDTPAMLGVLEVVTASGDLEEFCGFLAKIAMLALRVSAGSQAARWSW